MIFKLLLNIWKLLLKREWLIVLFLWKTYRSMSVCRVSIARNLNQNKHMGKDGKITSYNIWIFNSLIEQLQSVIVSQTSKHLQLFFFIFIFQCTLVTIKIKFLCLTFIREGTDQINFSSQQMWMRLFALNDSTLDTGRVLNWATFAWIHNKKNMTSVVTTFSFPFLFACMMGMMLVALSPL